MPRIKRWHPISHDLNADTEVWELTETFGDRSLRIWIEVLSIGDRNNGILPGKWKDYARLLAGRCRSSRRHVEKVCEWVARWLEIDSEGVASIRNYKKYHRTEEHNPAPPRPDQTGPDLYKIHTAPKNGADYSPSPKKNRKRDKLNPTPAQLESFNRFWEPYPRKDAREEALNEWLKLNPDQELESIIVAAVHQYAKWTYDKNTERQHIKMAAPWLRAKRWTDQGVVSKHQSAPRPAMDPL